MKRIIALIFVTLGINSALAYDYNSDIINNKIKDEQQVLYCQKDNTWGANCTDSNFEFTKRITYGSGGYSLYEKDKKIYDTDTTYEFIHNNKLIGYNSHKLKFYNLIFENDKFQPTELSVEELNELFPDVEIVKVSEFNNDEITLYKPFFKTKTILLVNDTDKYFYKYQFENYKKQDELIRGLIEVSKAQTLVFSHFGSRDKLFPILTIHIKNKFTE